MPNELKVLGVPAVTFGRIIAAARKRKGYRWSQEELAARSGVSCSSIGKYETGAVDPSWSHALRLIYALGGRITIEFDEKEEDDVSERGSR